MGLYNLVHTDAACPACGLVAERELQLHYGAKQLYSYRLGDRLIWH